jgi:hypothetical protein
MLKRALMIPYTFTLLNWASVAGLYYFLSRKDSRALWRSVAHHPAATAQNRASQA